MINFKELHSKLLPIYSEASDIALKGMNHSHHNFEKKEENGRISVVTQSDTKINQLFIDALPKVLPGSAVIGEEQSTYSHEQFAWVIDPIDGTGNYQKGIDMWGISIALFADNEPVYAALIFPRQVEKLFYGYKNGGVYDQDDKKMNLKKNSEYKPAFAVDTIAKGFSDHIRAQEFGMNLSYRATGSTVYDGYNLVKGGYDFVIIYKLAAWDIAAIWLLTSELGYKLDFLQGQIPITDARFSQYQHVLLISKVEIQQTIYPVISRAIESFEAKES